MEQRRLRELDSGELAHRRQELGGEEQEEVTGYLGWSWSDERRPEACCPREQCTAAVGDGVWRRSGEWLATGRPWEDSARLGEWGRSAARHRSACAWLAASSSMPAAAWLGNERGNSRNAQERGEHEH